MRINALASRAWLMAPCTDVFVDLHRSCIVDGERAREIVNLVRFDVERERHVMRMNSKRGDHGDASMLRLVPVTDFTQSTSVPVSASNRSVGAKEIPAARTRRRLRLS